MPSTYKFTPFIPSAQPPDRVSFPLDEGRGEIGNIAEVVVGASLIVVLKNLVNILEIPSQLEYVVIGGAILLGVFANESLKRRAVARP